jgi:hypothetical protein
LTIDYISTSDKSYNEHIVKFVLPLTVLGTHVKMELDDPFVGAIYKENVSPLLAVNIPPKVIGPWSVNVIATFAQGPVKTVDLDPF